jgi:glucose dehydrogenase
VSGAPMEEIDADIVVIGAGVVGGLMAWALSQRGFNVAILESGPPIDRDEAIDRFKFSPTKTTNSAYEDAPYAPVPGDINPLDYYVQPALAEAKGPREQLRFNGLYTRGVGGSSWHWTGHAERFGPSDFKMYSLFGRGADWPISYEELIPYYEEVERQWGVAGGPECIQPPLTTGYPMPTVPPTYLDRKVAEAAAKLGIKVAPLPHARNSLPYDGRPQCCGNASCRFICPIAAKYDGSVHVMKAQSVGTRLYSKRVVNRIDVDADQKVQAVWFLHPDGTRGRAKGKLYILAAHAIEVPKLLLMSQGPNTPHGVANSSDAVGRYLMGQIDVDTGGYAPFPVYPFRGPYSATSGIDGLRDGAFREQFAAASGFVVNGGFSATLGVINEADAAISQGVFGSALRERVLARSVAQVQLSSSIEILPDPENRVTLALELTDALGLPRPSINFRLDDYTMRGITEARKRDMAILKEMGVTEFVRGEPGTSQAIIAGTARMGDDSRTSVVDRFCRSHDHDNLFIIGTCSYVTTPVPSPSMTAAALALRAVDHIAATFKAG